MAAAAPNAAAAAAAARDEIKPEMAFEETSENVSLTLVIDGLRAGRKLKSPLKIRPKNARVLEAEFGKQSLNYAIQMKPNKVSSTVHAANSGKTYRLHIKRLPTEIDPLKTKLNYENDKVVIILAKKVHEPWRPYVDVDFETIQNVKS